MFTILFSITLALSFAALLGMARYSNSATIGGKSISGSKSRTPDNEASYEPVIPAGKTVTAWVKSDANTAGCDLPTGHGYSNGNFDVYWEGGRRYGVPGTISTNALTLDGGTGDDFPASATVGVVVCRQVQVNIAIDGDVLALFAAKPTYADQAADTRAAMTFHDAANDQIAHLDLQGNRLLIIDVTGGDTNPFTGDPITYALCSNGNPSAAVTLQIGVAQDSTP